MAEARIPASWFAQGYAPQMCARHGGPATTTRRRSFATPTSPWLYLVLLGSILVFVVVALILRKSVEGPIPECALCPSERRNYVMSVLGAWISSLALIISGGFAGSSSFLVLGGIAAAAALVWSCLGDLLRVRGSLSRDHMWVCLRGLHESFAGELDRATNIAHQPAPAVAQAGRTGSAPIHVADFGAGGRDILPGR